MSATVILTLGSAWSNIGRPLAPESAWWKCLAAFTVMSTLNKLYRVGTRGPARHVAVSIHTQFMTPVEVATDGRLEQPQTAPKASTSIAPAAAAGASQWPNEQARASLVGKRVHVHNLTAAQFNGCHGVVQLWEAERGRYAVKLDGRSQPILA